MISCLSIVNISFCSNMYVLSVQKTHHSHHWDWNNLSIVLHVANNRVKFTRKSSVNHRHEMINHFFIVRQIERQSFWFYFWTNTEQQRQSWLFMRDQILMITSRTSVNNFLFLEKEREHSSSTSANEILLLSDFDRV